MDHQNKRVLLQFPFWVFFVFTHLGFAEAPVLNEAKPNGEKGDAALTRILGKMRERGELQLGFFTNRADFQTAWIESVVPARSNTVETISYQSALVINRASGELNIQCKDGSKKSRIAVDPTLTAQITARAGDSLHLEMDDNSIMVRDANKSVIYSLMARKIPP